METGNIKECLNKIFQFLQKITSYFRSQLFQDLHIPPFQSNNQILFSLEKTLSNYLDSIYSDEFSLQKKSFTEINTSIDTSLSQIKANLCGKFKSNIYLQLFENIKKLCTNKVHQEISQEQLIFTINLFQNLAKKILNILCRQDKDTSYTSYLSTIQNVESLSNELNNYNIIDGSSLEKFYELYTSTFDCFSSKLFQKTKEQDFQNLRKTFIPKDNVQNNENTEKILEQLEEIPLYKQYEIKFDGENQCRYACDPGCKDITLLKYCGNAESFSIPYGVTNIGEDAFTNNNQLKFVQFPNTVQIIEKGSFANCQNLIYLQLPNNLQKIDDRAFAGCSNLLMIKIPQSIQSIGETIFMDKNYKLLIVDQKREKDQKNAYNALNYQFNGYIHSL